MAHKDIVRILIERDGLTPSEANAAVDEAKALIEDAAERGDYMECEDIMYSELGLELDYIFDVLGF